MTDKEKWELTLKLVDELRNMDADTREEWRKECLEQAPDTKDYVEAALNVVESQEAQPYLDAALKMAAAQ